MPFYHDLPETELTRRTNQACSRLSECDLCPRQCGTNRLRGEVGFCGAGADLRVSSAFPHHGEEPAISGQNGSGTIFFSHCTLRCLFCQNHQISHGGHGEEWTEAQLAEEMLLLQNRGCHNINLVTPTHYVPHILRALQIAIPKGLAIPIVYNTSGFDTLSTLLLLDGIVDIYLPDIKYADNTRAKSLSSCEKYVAANRLALKEMWRQVGPLVVDQSGVAAQGMIVRHLVLPQKMAGSESSLAWLAQELGREVAVSLMAQYSPRHRADELDHLNRRITREEYLEAVAALDRAGLSEGWIQDWQGMDGHYLIDFVRRKRERLIGPDLKKR